VVKFLELLRAAITSGRAHIMGDEGGCPGLHEEALGWRLQPRRKEGDLTIWLPQGRAIGWIDGDDLYLQPEAAYATVQELARSANQSLPIGTKTLWKHLDAAKVLLEKDPGRNTTRIMFGGKREHVLKLSAKTALGLGASKDDKDIDS
jgi:hypothetical protein